ncbi:Crp/Fnr family transcriptional regulator [Kitasatospora sp. NPDC057936]|uniref:Crp/Fnr family transcriptional regulator n=1 Tax=Kitasatospora sp. NPDC057936 TaxID=3346283 RepID=UPI0036D8BF7F
MSQPPDTVTSRMRRPARSWLDAATVPLPRSSFIRRLNTDQRAALSRIAVPQTYDGGSVISNVESNTGTKSFTMQIIVSGWVMEEVSYPDGTQGVTLRGPGDLIGDSILFSPRDSFRAVSATIVLAASIPSSSFRGFLQNYPAAMESFCRLLTTRLQMLQLQHERTNQPPAARINSLLLDLSTYADPARPTFPYDILGLSQADLARILKLSRPSVENHIRELRRSGTITTGRRRITLINPVNLGTRASLPDPDDYEDDAASGSGYVAVLSKGKLTQIRAVSDVRAAEMLTRSELGWHIELLEKSSTETCVAAIDRTIAALGMELIRTAGRERYGLTRTITAPQVASQVRQFIRRLARQGIE